MAATAREEASPSRVIGFLTARKQLHETMSRHGLLDAAGRPQPGAHGR
jgi:hypothetical protein